MRHPRLTALLSLATALMLTVVAPALAHVIPSPAIVAGPASTSPLVSSSAPVVVDVAPHAAPPAEDTGGQAAWRAPAMDGDAAPWIALAAAVLVLLPHARSRRALVVTLVCLIALVTFETGVHSVHHVGQMDASACTVASASSQVSVTLAPPVVFDVVPEPATTWSTASVVPTLRSRPLPPDAGRSPPSRLA